MKYLEFCEGYEADMASWKDLTYLLEQSDPSEFVCCNIGLRRKSWYEVCWIKLRMKGMKQVHCDIQTNILKDMKKAHCDTQTNILKGMKEVHCDT